MLRARESANLPASLLMLLAACLSPCVRSGQGDEPEAMHHGEKPEHFLEAIARADKAMSSVKRGDLETRNFLIATDVFDDAVLRQLGGSLEGAYYEINSVLDLPIAPATRKVRVYFFEKESQHYRTLGLSRGAYLAPGLLTFYQGHSDTQELLDVLVHEATHAFLDQFIVEPEVQFPTWLDEGFAMYMGYSFVIDGQIRAGLFYSTQEREFLHSVERREAPAATAAKRIVRRIKRGPLITLDELVTAERTTFYGRNRRDHYYLAWAFVHFLRHGTPDGKKRFPRLVAAFARGSESTAAFDDAYSQSPAELEKDFHSYVINTLAKPPRAPR